MSLHETPAPLVVIDIETTGLGPDDEMWEVAAYARTSAGLEHELHLFVDHDRAKCAALPKPFHDDHMARWPGPGGSTPPGEAAFLIDTFLRAIGDRPHVIGAVPSFDTEHLERLLRAHCGPNWQKPWHYHLVDVENLAVGFLRGQFPDIPMHPPWNSELLSAAVGVPVIPEERHTALGDVKWALRIYDKIMEV